MATRKEVAQVFRVLEGGIGKMPLESVEKEWPTFLAKHDAETLLQAARALVTDAERTSQQWPTLGEVLKYYYRLRTDAFRRAEQPTMRPFEAASLHGKYARTLSESVGDNRWQPTTPLAREAAAMFRELLHHAHGAGEIQGRLTPAHVHALASLGGHEWLKLLQPHEVMMAREAFCARVLVQHGQSHQRGGSGAEEGQTEGAGDDDGASPAGIAG
jgi:hypothetical protein